MHLTTSKEGSGSHMLRHTGMCCWNGLLFFTKKIEDIGPILVKLSLEEGRISQKLQKTKQANKTKIMVNSGVERKPSEMRPEKILKKKSN